MSQKFPRVGFASGGVHIADAIEDQEEDFSLESHIAANSAFYDKLKADHVAIRAFIIKGKLISARTKQADEGGFKAVQIPVSPTLTVELVVKVPKNNDLTRNRVSAVAHRYNHELKLGLASSLVRNINLVPIDNVYDRFSSILGARFSFQFKYLQKVYEQASKDDGIAKVLLLLGSMCLDYASYPGNKEQSLLELPTDLATFLELVKADEGDTARITSAYIAATRQIKNLARDVYSGPKSAEINKYTSKICYLTRAGSVNEKAQSLKKALSGDFTS